MTEEQDKLLRGCHEMLCEILSYIRKIDSPQYRDNMRMEELIQNLAANFAVEGLFYRQQKTNNQINNTSYGNKL